MDKIKISSHGKAREESVFTDGYQRKWLVRTWATEYNDQQTITFSLPVPGGLVIMMRGGETALTKYHSRELEVLTDFIYLSYNGNLKQWREFLTIKKLLPEVFSAINIDFDYGKSLSYSSKRLAFIVEQKNMAITENSYLRLNLGYFLEANRTVWDVKRIVVGEDKNSSTNFGLARNTRPPGDIGDKYKITWGKMVNGKMPYNKTSYIQDKSSAIITVYARNIPHEKLETAAVLYSVGYLKEGNFGQKEMETALDTFLQNLTVFEDWQANEPAANK
jgi:hypothetical protein